MANVKEAIWINLGYCNDEEENKEQAEATGHFTLTTKSVYTCPNCKEKSVGDIHEIQISNAEYEIMDSITNEAQAGNNYKYIYPHALDFKKNDFRLNINVGKIKQRCKGTIEDAIKRDKQATESGNFDKLLTTLRKYKIEIEKSTKWNKSSDQKKIFEMSQFIILCEDEANLNAVVDVLKRAPEFHMTLSEDKNYFVEQFQTHYRIHIVKLYCPSPYDVYIEMQLILKAMHKWKVSKLSQELD